jgi:plasmid stabilization system protein ParE
MQLRGTEDAANDLERITDYLLQNAPDRAHQPVQRLYDAPSSLLTFPNLGRAGKVHGTRELVIAPRLTSSYTPFGAMSSSLSASCMVRSNGRSGIVLGAKGSLRQSIVRACSARQGCAAPLHPYACVAPLTRPARALCSGFCRS